MKLHRNFNNTKVDHHKNFCVYSIAIPMHIPMLNLYTQWEHSFGNTVDDMIDDLPIITKHSIVKNLYNGMFNKVNSIIICTVLLFRLAGDTPYN